MGKFLDDAGLAHYTSQVKKLLAGKQDELAGAQGQVVGFGADGKAVAQAAPDPGVTSFNGRTGAVAPKAGDFTAEQVGFNPGGTGMAAQTVQRAIEELFTSGSEGKAGLASAITSKGVITAADASFDVLRENILAIPTDNLPEGIRTIHLEAGVPEGGTVSGGGAASEGMTVTVAASPVGDYSFLGWKENGEVVHLDKLYTFLVNRDRNLEAAFKLYVSGADWWEATLPASAVWQSITYGGGKFVAVTYNNNLAAYSPDGITWKTTVLPASTTWQSVAYGNGKFVAVAYNSSQAAYSTDGITWKTAALPSSAYWQGVTYGGGKFVAAAYNSNKAAYSTDGITWTASTLPASTYWRGITYGDGTFVTVSNGSEQAAYSTDGITWKAAVLPSSAYWQDVAYGGGKFVAIANYANKAAYSTNGITWTAATLPSSASWRSVTYGDGKFVAIVDFSSKAAYSTNGITWTAATLPSSASWWSITCGDGRFVIVASNSSKAAYSTVKGPGVSIA